MDDYSKIKNLILSMTKKPDLFFIMKVVSVEGETCTVEHEGATFSDVRLGSVVTGSDRRLTITPAVGSYILAVDVSEGGMSDLTVVKFSEIERIDMAIGDTTIRIDREGVVLNGGELGGMVKVREMANWMSKVYNDLSALKVQLASTPVAGQGAPLGLVFNMTVPAPAVKDFANEKIRQ
jgi:hypothetical protein